MEIPISLIGLSGDIINDPVAGVPCIRASMAANIDGTPLAYSAWALLDTGADNIFVERGLSDHIGAQQVGFGPVHSATEVIDQPIYNAFLFVEGLPPLSTGYSAVQMPRAHGRYHIVLGRSFIRLFDFRFDRQTQAFVLSAQAPVHRETEQAPRRELDL